MIRYPVELRNADGGVTVTFPDLPEAITWGTDEADALDAASDCLRAALESRLKDNEPIPRPSPADGRRTVALPVVDSQPEEFPPAQIETAEDFLRAIARLLARARVRREEHELAEAVAARTADGTSSAYSPDSENDV